LESIETADTILLRLLDPYGDVVLARDTLPTLASEIETKLPSASMDRLHAARRSLLDHAIAAGWQESVIVKLRAKVTETDPASERADIVAHMRDVARLLREASASEDVDQARFAGD
jgi:type VI protein secretion system component VasF